MLRDCDVEKTVHTRMLVRISIGKKNVASSFIVYLIIDHDEPRRNERTLITQTPQTTGESP